MLRKFKLGEKKWKSRKNPGKNEEDMQNLGNLYAKHTSTVKSRHCQSEKFANKGVKNNFEFFFVELDNRIFFGLWFHSPSLARSLHTQQRCSADFSTCVVDSLPSLC